MTAELPIHSQQIMTLIWTQTAEWDEEEATNYQSQIGILHWIVELGRIVIATEVSLLASHVALTRKGHQQTVNHIYAYLKKRHNS